MDNKDNKVTIHIGSGSHHHMHGRHHRHYHYHDYDHEPNSHIALHLNWIQIIIVVAIFVSIFISAIFFFNKMMVENTMNSVKTIYTKYVENSRNDQYIKSVKIKSIEKDNESQRYYFTYESDPDWASRIFYGSTRIMFTENSIKKYNVGNYVDVVLNFPNSLNETEAIPKDSINTSYTDDSQFILGKKAHDSYSTKLTISLTCAVASIIIMIVYSIILHKKNKVTDTQKVTSSIDSTQSIPQIKKCNYCGQKNDPSNKHCTSCGAKLE